MPITALRRAQCLPHTIPPLGINLMSREKGRNRVLILPKVDALVVSLASASDLYRYHAINGCGHQLGEMLTLVVVFDAIRFPRAMVVANIVKLNSAGLVGLQIAMFGSIAFPAIPFSSTLQCRLLALTAML
jgi:hypothetical protein